MLACSALKQKYRDTLMRGLDGVALVYASGSRELIAGRMRERAERAGHFMPVTLLDSRFATLEPPTDAIEADIRLPLDDLVGQVIAAVVARR